MKKIIPISIIVILLIVVAYAVIDDLKKAKESVVVEEGAIEEVGGSNDNRCLGYISGVLEFNFGEIKIPGNMYICAKNLNTGEYYCTSEIIKDYNFSGKDGYQLVVTNGGQYQVAGIFPDSINPNYQLKELSHSAHCLNNICHETPRTFSLSCNENKENIDLNYGHSAMLFKDFDVYNINR